MKTFLLLIALVTFSGCTSAGIAMRETLGTPKRTQVVDRVKDARDSQQAAKKQFESTLDEFLVVTGQKGQPGKVADLETQYKKFKAEHERCESRAADVSSRIADVEAVGGKLFDEWRGELKQYTSDDTRRRAQKLYDDSHANYDHLLAAMKTAESKMKPVLAAFKDQELFLKHNLDAAAIASLSGTAQQIQTDVANLIRDMESSIAEANKFIEQMGKQ
jgi:hypothetical protein